MGWSCRVGERFELFELSRVPRTRKSSVMAGLLVRTAYLAAERFVTAAAPPDITWHLQAYVTAAALFNLHYTTYKFQFPASSSPDQSEPPHPNKPGQSISIPDEPTQTLLWLLVPLHPVQRPHKPRVRPDGVDVPRVLLAARHRAGLRDLGLLGAHLGAVFLRMSALLLPRGWGL